MKTATQDVKDYLTFKKILTEKAVGKHKRQISESLHRALEHGTSIGGLVTFAEETGVGDKLWTAYRLRHSAVLKTGQPYNFTNYIFEVVRNALQR